MYIDVMATIPTKLKPPISIVQHALKPAATLPLWWRLTRRRFWIATILWALQALYFPINRLAKGDRNLSIAAIDGRMPRLSIFVAPYAFGFWYLGSVNHVAAALLSKKYWQEHCIALFTITLTGFMFWLFFPARVVKRSFQPRPKHLFDQVLKTIHASDKGYGQHNSFPSSHVYYVNVGLHYLKKEYPQYGWFFDGSVAVNAMSTLFTHQHYVADVVAGFGLSYAVTRLTDTMIAPKIRAYLDHLTD